MTYRAWLLFSLLGLGCAEDRPSFPNSTNPDMADPSDGETGDDGEIGDDDETGDDGDTGDDPSSPDCGNGSIEKVEACDDGSGNQDGVAGACNTRCQVSECTDGDSRSCAEEGLFGACAEGVQLCDGGTWGECDVAPTVADSCVAGNDSNCNGELNEDCDCLEGSTQSCSLSGALGNCAVGEQFCNAEGEFQACSVRPGDADSCVEFGDDADCDGKENAGCECVMGDNKTCGTLYGSLGACAEIQLTCGAAGTWPDETNCGDCSTTCGDGIEESGEDCDDGNAETERCSASESSCIVCSFQCLLVAGELPAPAMPTIDGESSAGHTSPSWMWTTPSGTDYFEFKLDDASYEVTGDSAHGESGLDMNQSYVLYVRACNANDVCSDPATFTTILELRGQDYPGVWKGVAKADLATTPLGHIVPVSCHNCYSGSDDELYSADQAIAKIDLALTRGADLIELDWVAAKDGLMCVSLDSVGEESPCTDRPTLQEILDDPTFAGSEALLFMELRGRGGMSATDFANVFLEQLNNNRQYVRNGRPVFIRAFDDRRADLEAIRSKLPDYPFIENYVRFSILHKRNEVTKSAINDVRDAGFDMMELSYEQDDLMAYVTYGRNLGLGVGVYTIPGSYGHAYIATLREEVDQMTTEFRMDLSRSIIEEQNTLAYISAADCEAGTARLQANTGGSKTETFISLDSTVGAYSTPTSVTNGIDEGCSFDFSSGSRWLLLGEHPAREDSGFLVSAIVKFNDLDVDDTQAIFSSSEAGGFALELDGNGGSTALRFGVYVDGAYHYHSLEVSGLLNIEDSFILTGMYDGDGKVSLLVDNAENGLGPSVEGAVADSGVSSVLGADPQGDGEARFFFDGTIRSAQLLDWSDHSFSGSDVN